MHGLVSHFLMLNLALLWTWCVNHSVVLGYHVTCHGFVKNNSWLTSQETIPTALCNTAMRMRLTDSFFFWRCTPVDNTLLIFIDITIHSWYTYQQQKIRFAGTRSRVNWIIAHLNLLQAAAPQIWMLDRPHRRNCRCHKHSEFRKRYLEVRHFVSKGCFEP
jgi:hypothetical protein